MARYRSSARDIVADLQRKDKANERAIENAINRDSAVPWKAVSFTNSWVNYDVASFAPAAYMRDSAGIVHLRGLIKNGTVGASAFTLPVGFRPAAGIMIFAVISNNTTGRIDVTASNGTVVPLVGSNLFFSLWNISFPAEI